MSALAKSRILCIVYDIGDHLWQCLSQTHMLCGLTTKPVVEMDLSEGHTAYGHHMETGTKNSAI